MNEKDFETAVLAGGDEFEKDGGYSYSDRVLQEVQDGNPIFDDPTIVRSMCVTLCTLVSLLLQEYGSVVSQLEAMGIKLVSLPKKGQS